MSTTLRTALCPLTPPVRAAAPPTDGDGPSGGPSGLAYSLTLPGCPLSAGIARIAVRAALHAHALDRYALPAQLAVSELIATAVRLTLTQDVYLSLRYRSEAEALRLVVWDQHPRHRDPDAEALCAERRRRSLWLLAAAVDDWGGEWGISDAQPPHQGTKSWVLLPR